MPLTKEQMELFWTKHNYLAVFQPCTFSGKDIASDGYTAVLNFDGGMFNPPLHIQKEHTISLLSTLRMAWEKCHLSPIAEFSIILPEMVSCNECLGMGTYPYCPVHGPDCAGCESNEGIPGDDCEDCSTTGTMFPYTYNTEEERIATYAALGSDLLPFDPRKIEFAIEHLRPERVGLLPVGASLIKGVSLFIMAGPGWLGCVAGMRE